MTTVAAKHRTPSVGRAAPIKKPPVVSSSSTVLEQDVPALNIASSLLTWYDGASRDLPWRIQPEDAASTKPDPYKIWLSEVMLQQTTVKAVIPYFNAFLRRWPTVRHLACASIDDVLSAWAGLGYYYRAHNLYKCARVIVELHDGQFPRTEAELQELPGIGPYTAAAIAAIAFGERATPVDGNVERVVSRLFNVDKPMPAAKPELRRLAALLTPTARTGDFAQATMDLGATICTPKRPSCMICPLTRWCQAQAAGTAASLPVRTPKGVKPIRRGIAFMALREDGYVLMRRRPDDGLLARMLEVPSTAWSDAWPVNPETGKDAALQQAPLQTDWWEVPGIVVHTFTHFRLELRVFRAVVPVDINLTLWSSSERCMWIARHDLRRLAVPSLFRKVIGHAMGD